MLPLLAFAVLIQPADRTPAIYRCPAKEAESVFFESLLKDHGFDTICVDPKPGPSATKIAKGKVKFIDPKRIDTKANLAWRNATIAFASAKISPKEWLRRTKNLKETIHFLSSPKTKDLRTQMASVPVDPGQTYSGRSVFAEFVLLTQPGIPCLTADDIWQTRYLPPAGKHQSWVLAMNDYMGPMLYFRHESPYLVTGKPKIIRADAKPGLLIFSQTNGKKTVTFYLNNSFEPMELPKIDTDKLLGIQRGLNIEGPKPILMPTGIIIEES